jgi:glycosyltransferase involved in cell wall biosynthesis
MKKLAIISSHPIQYNAPLFALMAENGLFELKVFYTWGEESIKPKFDPDFRRVVEWDIPLLNGYQYQFVKNVAKNPGSHHFFGIDNPDLINDLESWGADVVWVWGWSFKSHLKAIRHFHSKIPVWFRGDSTLIDQIHQPKWRRFVRSFLLSWVYKKVDLAFYVGKHNKNYFLNYGLKESELVYAPHAVDVDRFSDWNANLQSQLDQWKSELGIGKVNFVVLFVGKFEFKKYPLFILELAKQIPDKKFKFLLVGDGNLKDQLKADAREDERILFIPFQNQRQMPLVYRLGDVYILPSQGPNETWGLAINEAMASGIPVLASQFCGGAIDLIQENCGSIFALDNVRAVANTIEGWSIDHELYLKMKEEVQKQIQDFSYQKIVDAVIERVKML